MEASKAQRVVAVLQRPVDSPAPQPRHDGRQRRAQLEPRERPSDAAVHARAEPDVLADIGSSHVEAIGILQCATISVGGSDHRVHQIPASQGSPAELGVDPHDSAHHLGGGAEPRDLLDGPVERHLTRLDQGVLRWVLEQFQETQYQRIAGREHPAA